MESLSSTNPPEVRAIRKWFFLALVISLGLHGLLYEFLRAKKMERFTFSTSTARLIPRAFTVKKVTISEDLLKPASTPEPKVAEPPKTVLRNEKPSAEKLPSDVRFSPSAAPGGDLAKAITAEKPRVEPGKISTPEANAQVEKEINSLPDQIGPKSAPKVVAGTGGAVPSDGNAHEGQGYSNIDTLLAQTGPINGKTRIAENMPGGALFEFDSAKLSKEAEITLRPLGALLARDPRTTVIIEGYTDTFGTPEYNLKLSRSRAEAVKAWLVSNMKLAPSHIQTKGFGSTQLIDPATGTREEQKRNRRVEIVIRTPKD